jgi:alpha-tubulin suppressor-like RCC1 family protein
MSRKLTNAAIQLLWVVCACDSGHFDSHRVLPKLAFIVQPSMILASYPIAPAVQVAVQNPLGNTVATANTSITVAIGTNPAGGTLSGTVTVAAVNGIATFLNLSIDNPGAGYTLDAFADGLNGASSEAFDVFDFDYHNCAVTTAGPVYCWGLNVWGQLGNGSNNNSGTLVAVSTGPAVAAVSAGDGHTCSLTTTGAAYCWGRDLSGELGNGSNGWNFRSAVAVLGGLTFAAVSAGGEYTCGVTTTGAAYCWGWNFRGMLGDGSNAMSNTPVAVLGGLSFSAVSAGVGHTCGVTTTGAAYCWGENGSGELGNGEPSLDFEPVPVAVSGGLTFVAVSAGGAAVGVSTFPHTCGVTTTGVAYCWGDNYFGQLGNGQGAETGYPEPVPVAVSGGLTFVAVSAGGGHTCGVTTTGAAYCWGKNYFGQLGNGETGFFAAVPVAVSGGLTFAGVRARSGHSCGVTTSGAGYCWGRNNVGQLGNGSTTDSRVPVAVSGGLTFVP